MKTNERGSENQNRDINSGRGSKQPVNQPGRENPEKIDPTKPEHPDHTEPEPRKNDPTRISPDWNDPSKTDPTRPEDSAVHNKGTSKTTEQKTGRNPNYTGKDYPQKDKSGEKNYSGTSAGFAGDEENHEDEPEDHEKKK